MPRKGFIRRFFGLSNKSNDKVKVVQLVHTRGESPERASTDPLEYIREGYEKNPTFFAAVDRIVKNVDSVSWFVETKQYNPETGEYEWKLDTEHKVNRLLTSPNPVQKMTFDMHIKGSVISLLVGGNFIWYKVRDDLGEVRYWQLLPLYAVKPKLDDTGVVTYYEYQQPYGSSYRTIHIPARDIIHGFEYNPTDPTWGLSKLKVLAETIDTDNAAQEWNLTSTEGRGVPDGTFIIKGEVEEEEYERAKERIRENYYGPSNGRLPWLITGDVEWIQRSLTPVEMDFLNSRKFNRSLISAVMGVPLPLLGDMDAATYNNVAHMKKSLWEDAIIPILNLIMSTVNLDLAEEYSDSVRINYSLADVQVLRPDYGAKLNDALKLQKLGVDLKEINRILDLGINFDD